MKGAVEVLRGAGALLLAFLACLATFGLVLALLQSLPVQQDPGVKLGTALASAALAIFSGGVVAAVSSRGARSAHGALFGLIFGAASFTYIFGFSWLVLPSTAIAVALAGLGGVVAGRGLARREARASSNAF